MVPQIENSTFYTNSLKTHLLSFLGSEDCSKHFIRKKKLKMQSMGKRVRMKPVHDVGRSWLPGNQNFVPTNSLLKSNLILLLKTPISGFHTYPKLFFVLFLPKTFIEWQSLQVLKMKVWNLHRMLKANVYTRPIAGDRMSFTVNT